MEIKIRPEAEGGEKKGEGCGTFRETTVEKDTKSMLNNRKWVKERTVEQSQVKTSQQPHEWREKLIKSSKEESR